MTGNISPQRNNIKKISKFSCGCIISILFVIILFVGWLLIDIYLSYNHDPDIASREEAINSSIKIEKLTGFRLPDFDVINYKSSGYTLFGDFADTIVVRFRSVPSEKVQNQLEESSVFHITNDSTGYDYINNKRDFAIKITLDKKSNTGEIMLFNGLVPAS